MKTSQHFLMFSLSEIGDNVLPLTNSKERNIDRLMEEKQNEEINRLETWSV